MDTEAHVWTVPATRMKANREHRVPLCRRAVEILGTVRTLGDGDSPLVFTINDARSDLFERRRRLMDDWAAYVGGQAADSSRH